MNNNTTPINKTKIKIDIPFKLAEAPPRITMNNPEFAKLTAAEKLNDSIYRSLVYRAYPNEPTCGCVRDNAQRSSNPTLTIDNHHNNSSVNYLLECPGGCKNSCCSSLRRSPIANNENNGNDDKVAEGSIASSFYCVGNQRTNGFNNSCYSLNERIRGGGSCCSYGDPLGEKYRTNPGAVDTELTKHNLWWHRHGSYDATSSRFADYSPELRRFECNELNFNPMSGGWCPAREKLNNRALASHQDDKWKNPQFNIDRLTHVLEDAQKFVDSLGKVPGMAGLGLMDPTESPYFHTNRQLTHEQMSETINDNNLMQLPMVNPHVKSQSPTSPWIKATPFTISVPGRGGIVREAILPQEPHVNELEQATETGPCGEINCKSRRKKIIHGASLNKIEGVEEINQVVDKRKSRRESKYRKYRRRDRRRKVFRSKGAKKVNYVYFAGDTYPVSVYGHKNCSQRRERVPANMGWLWTQYQPVGKLKPRVGWRPGTMSRQIREMIREGKATLERSRRRRSSVPSSGMRGRKLRTRSHTSLKKGHSKKLDEEKEESEPSPTLRIRRKDGTYWINMYPIMQETMDVPMLETPINPLQFRIPKRYDDSSEGEGSSTASDIDIEYSPPAAINRYKKKPNVVHVETQAKQQDIDNALKPVDSKGKELVEPERKANKKKGRKKSKKRK